MREVGLLVIVGEGHPHHQVGAAGDADAEVLLEVRRESPAHVLEESVLRRQRRVDHLGRRLRRLEVDQDLLLSAVPAEVVGFEVGGHAGERQRLRGGAHLVQGTRGDEVPADAVALVHEALHRLLHDDRLVALRADDKVNVGEYSFVKGLEVGGRHLHVQPIEGRREPLARGVLEPDELGRLAAHVVEAASALGKVLQLLLDTKDLH
mmetsp:Transcript_73859/g.228163  ORF Transcript_73859/g.228163 Transcript_73859/m.228163 type:complete len:207 (-) Transcript_73859:13-633(-)